jgi:hypothetical protein
MARLSRRQSVLAILLVAVIVFFVFSLQGGRSVARPARHASATVGEEVAKPKAPVKLQPATPADVDFRRYAALASSTVFSPTRTVPTPVGPVKPMPPLPPLEWGPRPLPPPPPPPVPRAPDLSGWSYVGFVTMGGDKLGPLKLGIVQNDTTLAVEYLTVGDTFMGARVDSFDRESIRVGSGAASATLSRPRDFPLTPLSGGPVKPPGAASPLNPAGR